AFQEHTMLRIEHLCLTRTHTKKRSIEAVGLLQYAMGADVRRVFNHICRDACCHQLVLREERDGFHPGAQIPPVFVDVPRPGQATAHANDSDIVPVYLAAHPGISKM